eukprot:CAMPEP_0119519914 /NCGR_PEP_ID=MMETSP1344-20130328/36069_1 /TAXON_ID=236787 /ORGANISM="Florenciella parvula, Strain CCMP2471" /LENGTH=109 /DNA_ID=CAMNT_0007557743 /DNA_START=129 /DNA_END=458 /DNA_ORIENTATION=-
MASSRACLSASRFEYSGNIRRRSHVAASGSRAFIAAAPRLRWLLGSEALARHQFSISSDAVARFAAPKVGGMLVPDQKSSRLLLCSSVNVRTTSQNMTTTGLVAEYPSS